MIKLLGSIISTFTLLSYVVLLSPLVIVVVLVSATVSLTSSFVLNKYKVRCKKERIISERKINYVNGIYSARQNAADIRMGIITKLLDEFFDKAYKEKIDIENILVLDSYQSKLESSLDLSIKERNLLEIRVDNLSFSYPAKTRKGIEVIKNVNFDIKAGEKVALVGHNGAGKSTIVKLILRFYDPTSGSIYLDGRAYSEYNLNALRSLFSTVFQDYQYYSFSIAENILLRSPQDKCDIEEVESALKEVGLYDKIHKMPLGVNTQLTKNFDNDGIVLSGGELQKLAIARALAQNTPIIIMDEPSSALDPLSERDISDILTKAFKDKMVFVISHRLSLTKDCNKIMVIDNGDIIEQGRHEELVAYGGKYAQLWEAQSKDYKEQNDCEKYS